MAMKMPRRRQLMDEGEDPANTTMPVGAPTPIEPPAVEPAAATPAMPATPPMSGGALARYGTGNIEGAGGLRTGSNALSGFNTGEWGTDARGTNSIKNTFGKIASRYGAKPSSLAQIVADPDFQRFFPEARIVEGGAGDKIDFGDGAPVDVLQSADPNSDTATAWAWMPEDDGGGGDLGLGGADAIGSGYDLSGILGGQGDPLTDIIARIQDLQSGQTPAAEQDALMRLLRGETI